MDIVALKPNGKSRSRRNSERRHTTEVRYEQLPSHHTLSQLERDSITSLSNENLSPRGDGLSSRGDGLSPRGNTYHHPVARMPYQGTRSAARGVGDSSHVPNGHQLSTSWGPRPPTSTATFQNNRDRSSSAQYFKGSQVNMFGEDEFADVSDVGERGMVSGDPVGVAGHQYQLSYELALDNVLTPFANPVPPISSLALMSITSKKPKLCDNPVMEEIIITETTYVRDVHEIISGYMQPLQEHVQSLPVSAHQINSLFGNIEDIRDFHRSLLDKFLECKGSVGKLGECFLHRVEDFKELYTHYCNNYPNSIQVLAQLSKVAEVSAKLKSFQQKLQHLLPLGAYLLKPVQRILRYHLLLSQMVKKTSEDKEGFSLAEDAMAMMTGVAEHINAMKRKYDTAIHVQEIQNLIRGHETCTAMRLFKCHESNNQESFAAMHTLDLTKCGDLVMEDTFRYFSGRNTSSAFRSRTDRYVFLFQKLYLVTKKEEDGGFQYKLHVEMKDLQLTERVEKEPNCFQIRQVSTGRAYTFQARHEAAKEVWVKKIKLLLVESIPHLPDKARMLIMGGFEVHTDASPVRDRRVHMGIDLGLSKKSQSLGRQVTPQMVHAHGSPPLGANSSKTRQRHQTSPLPVKIVDSSQVSSVHNTTFSRSESPSQGHSKSLSHTHAEVVSEVKYKIEATYSPKTRTSLTTLSSEEETMTTDSSSSSSLEGYYRHKEDANNHHANNNRGDHVHHLSSPPDVGSSQSPHVPSLFGKTHSSMHESNGGLDGYDATDAKLPPHVDQSSRFEAAEQHNGRASSHKGEGGLEDEALDGGELGHFEDVETLFDEIMSSSSTSRAQVDKRLSCMHAKTSSTNLDWGELSSRNSSLTRDEELGVASISSPGENQTSKHDHMDSSTTIGGHVSQSSSVDEGSTPRASPYTSPSTIRRWSVKKRRSYDQNDPDEQSTTPKTSPYIRRHHSARSTSASSVGSDNVFPLPDPPTPFKNSVQVERLGPFPDENLESLEDESKSDSTGGTESQRNSVMSVEEDALVTREDQDHHDSRQASNAPSEDVPGTNGTQELKEPETTSNPTAKKKMSKKKSSSSSKVKRSHSFGTNKRIGILHRHDGSLSTNNSPLPCPKFRAENKMAEGGSGVSNLVKVKQKRHSKGSLPREDLAGTTTPINVPWLDISPARESAASSPGAGSTHSLILPPPAEFKGSSPDPSAIASQSHNASSREVDETGASEKEERSLFSFFRIKHGGQKKSTRSATPVESMPEVKPTQLVPSAQPIIQEPSQDIPQAGAGGESLLQSCSSTELMSFDEALERYDQYSSQTGKTANSAKQAKNIREALKAAAPASLFPPSPSLSPSPGEAGGKKESKKNSRKKKRHGYTVANIDSDTMREVHKSLAQREESRKTSDSRVHQLAREYSQKIKDRNRAQKKYSTVFEDDYVAEEYLARESASKPHWLSQLGMSKKRQTSAGNILEVGLSREEDYDESSRCSSRGSSSGGGDLPEPRLLGSDFLGPHPSIDHRHHNSDDAAHFVDMDRGDLHRHDVEGGKRHTLSHFHQHKMWADEEEAKSGKLKSWVRSIAARFSKKEGTTL